MVLSGWRGCDASAGRANSEANVRAQEHAHY